MHKDGDVKWHIRLAITHSYRYIIMVMGMISRQRQSVLGKTPYLLTRRKECLLISGLI